MGDKTYLISLYVDDVLIAGSNEEEIDKIKKEFTDRYEMKDLGELNHYLGMKITITDAYSVHKRHDNKALVFIRRFGT